MPENFKILNATALAERLGLRRGTVLAYLSRRNFGRIPKPNRSLKMGPVWYERAVRGFERERKRAKMTKKRGNGEGTIGKRKDGTFFARYWVDTPGGPKRKTIYGRKGENHQEVAKRLAKAIADRDGRIVYDDKNLTVGDYLGARFLPPRPGDCWTRRAGTGSKPSTCSPSTPA